MSSADKTEADTGVYYISDSAYQEYKHQVLPQVLCDVCSRGFGKDGGELKKCKGCISVWYCSKECQSVAWPEHKRHCGMLKVVKDIQPRISRFLEHPGLLHHLRVALILDLGLLANARSEECLNPRVMLGVSPTSNEQYYRLFTGTGPTPEKIDGYLNIVSMDPTGQIDIGVPLSRQRPGVSLLVTMWKRAREISAAAGRKDNPIIVVDFNYDGENIPLGIEITREAFLTARGMPLQPSFNLPLKKPQVLSGMTSDSIIERINKYVQEDEQDKLGLRIEMREYDKEFIRTLG